MPVRIFLPPNLAATAARDAIAAKIQHDGDAPDHLVDLVGPKSNVFVQLTRRRLRDIVGGFDGQSVFYWIDEPEKPISWTAGILPGVSEHLISRDPETPPEPLKPLPPPIPKRPLPKKDPADRNLTPLTVDGSEHFLAITLPSREAIHYDPVLELLRSRGFVLEPSNRKWWLRDRHRVLNFLAEYRNRLENDFGADFSPNFLKNTAHLRVAEIDVKTTEAEDGYDVTVSLKTAAGDESKLRDAIASGRHYMESGKKVLLIDPERLEKLTAIGKALSESPDSHIAGSRQVRISRARLADTEVLIHEIDPNFQPPEAWKARSGALTNLSALEQAPIKPELDVQLRLYQRIGVAWLWHLYRNELGGILADEMGLGKTLQALALISALKSQREIPQPAAVSKSGRPIAKTSDEPPSASCLVICPASLVENWRREAMRFAPEVRVFVHHGSVRLAKGSDFSGYDLVVTSYGTLVRDVELFSALKFDAIIADEAQHIKNRRTQNAQSMRTLKARCRFILTGTPVENSLDDLRSLFDFVLPGYISRPPGQLKRDDKSWFDQRLRAQSAPYILRRTKAFVAPELPAKIEQVIYCELTPAQTQLYKEVQQKTERDLIDLEANGASENSVRFAALTQLLRLRQICCDPRLVTKEKSAAPFEDSAKLDAFRELVSEAVDDGHRILVFSQFTSLLGLIREDLVAQDITHCYLDGSMSPKARQAQVDLFNGDTKIPIFLISLKAGGTGLNLATADTVIHFDPWWNPAAEAQATDRAHRIGQKKIVTSYKFIAVNTVEEKVLSLQAEKRALLADVFEASDVVNAKLSLADLKSLLA